MRNFFCCTLIFVLSLVAPLTSHSETVFRFHVPAEPASLDPARLTSTDANYFFGNIARGLFTYSNEEGLRPDGAESCVFESQLRLVCKLAKDSFWSDGSRVDAKDYVRSFRRLLSKTSRAPTVELLSRVKNAVSVNAGKAGAETLGVRAEGADKLVIEFETADPDFLYKLTASVLVPVKLDDYPKRNDLKGVVFNGPYKVAQWISGRRIRLEPNPYYKRGNSKRPPVEVLFIDDEQTAMNLYEQKQLSFLRRLPTTFIATHKSRPDFKQVPVARFDYVGFGEDLRNQSDVRAALSFSANYRELQKVYNAVGIPGCPSLPETFLDKDRCITFDLERAKRHWAKVPEEFKKRRYKFHFSKLGGEDLKKGAEWFQAQWRKNLGIQVDLEQTEQGVFLKMLSSKPPAIFRKGVGLERPTCLAALETLSREGSENFLKLDDSDYQHILEKLTTLTKADKTGVLRQLSPEAKKACGEGVQFLIDRNLLIPLGRFYLTMLVDPKFKGWSLNEMNQLDLAGLDVR